MSDGVLFCSHDKCQRGFLSQEAYALHMEQAHTVEQFDCEQCQKSFDKQSALEAHVVKHHRSINTKSASKQEPDVISPKRAKRRKADGQKLNKSSSDKAKRVTSPRRDSHKKSLSPRRQHLPIKQSLSSSSKKAYSNNDDLFPQRSYKNPSNPEADYDDDSIESIETDRRGSLFSATLEQVMPILAEDSVSSDNDDVVRVVGGSAATEARRGSKIATSSTSSSGRGGGDESSTYADEELVQPGGIMLTRDVMPEDNIDEVTSSSEENEAVDVDTAPRMHDTASQSGGFNDNGLPSPREVTTRRASRSTASNESRRRYSPIAVDTKPFVPRQTTLQSAEPNGDMYDYSAVPAGDESLLRVRSLSARVPFEPLTYHGVPVPRFFGSPAHPLQKIHYIPPSHLVSQYHGAPTLHVRDLLAAGDGDAWLSPQNEPIVQLQTFGPFLLTLHGDDCLGVFDAHCGDGSDWRLVLECSEWLRDTAAPRSGAASLSKRLLLANEACVLIVADFHIVWWEWSHITAAEPDQTAIGAPTGQFQLAPDDRRLVARADFSNLDARGHLLIGGNQGFVLYDIDAATPLYRFTCASSNGISSFFSMRWSGECLVTLEKEGARVWRILPLSGVELSGGTASESGVASRVTAVVTAPPPLLPAADNAQFSAMYVDFDMALLADTKGRVRVLRLTLSPADVARAAGLSDSPVRRSGSSISTVPTTPLSPVRHDEDKHANDKAARRNSMDKLKNSDHVKTVGNHEDTSTSSNNHVGNRSNKSGGRKTSSSPENFDNDDENDTGMKDSSSENLAMDKNASTDGRASSYQGASRLDLDESESSFVDHDERNDKSNQSSRARGRQDKNHAELAVLLPLVQAGKVSALKAAVRSGAWEAVGRDGQTLLHHAAAHGLLELVQYILKRGAPRYIELRDENGWTALHTAASFGHPAVCEELLTKSKLGLFDRAARGGMTPLHFIARQAWRADATPKLLSVVLKLANDRIDVHNDALETPLHQACLRGSPEMVQWLLSHGARPDAQKESGETPLHIATRRGAAPLVRLLLEAGATPNLVAQDGRTPRAIAESLNLVPCAELLTRAMFDTARQRAAGRVKTNQKLDDVNDNVKVEQVRDHKKRSVALGVSPSRLPSKERSVAKTNPIRRKSLDDIVAEPETEQTKLRRGVSLSTVPQSEKSKTGLVARLLGRKAEPDSAAKQNLIVAMGRRGDTEKVKELLRKWPASVYGARDKHGQSLLHTASFAGNVELVNLLLSHKKLPQDAVTLRDKNGWTPLHAATSTGALDVASVLVDHGANLYTPTASARGGTTSAHYLARVGWSSTAKALWEKVFAELCLPDVRDARKQTPLFHAAAKNEPEAVKFLLKHGANGNVVDNTGDTALHTAVRSRASGALTALLDAGVELIKSPDGTPLDLARALDFTLFVQLLDDYRAVRYADEEKTVRLSPARRPRVRGKGGSVLKVTARSVSSINEPKEYLNRVSSSDGSDDKTANVAAKASGSPRRRGRRDSNFAPLLVATRINHVERDRNRVFVAQENGSVSVWSLDERLAKKPLSVLKCAGPCRVMRTLAAVVGVICPTDDGDMLGVEDSSQPDNKKKPSRKERRRKRDKTGKSNATDDADEDVDEASVPRIHVDVSMMQWGVDNSVTFLDSKGKPKTAATRLLSQHDLTLWLRLRDDNNGRVTDFDERHLLKPWTDAAMSNNLSVHNVTLVPFTDVSQSRLKMMMDVGIGSLASCRCPCTTASDVADMLGRLRRDNLPLAPLTMRGANGGWSGGGPREVMLPVFALLNRGGGFVTLYTIWSMGQRLPSPPVVLTALLRQVAPKRATALGPGSGAGRRMGPARRRVDSPTLQPAPVTRTDSQRRASRQSEPRVELDDHDLSDSSTSADDNDDRIDAGGDDDETARSPRSQGEKKRGKGKHHSYTTATTLPLSPGRQKVSEPAPAQAAPSPAKPRERQKSVSTSLVCILCQQASSEMVVLLPCGHLCVCKKCSNTCDECPSCDTPVVSKIAMQTQ